MRLLVTGGRRYRDGDVILRELSRIDAETPITCLIHGGAGGCDIEGMYGADVIAEYIAQEMGIEIDLYLPDWKQHGKQAGPIRNQRMIDEGKPDVVLAFPGNRGTADMVRRAKAAGVKVVEVSQ